jgi:hypothetical protein
LLQINEAMALQLVIFSEINTHSVERLKHKSEILTWQNKNMETKSKPLKEAIAKYDLGLQ